MEGTITFKGVTQVPVGNADPPDVEQVAGSEADWVLSSQHLPDYSTPIEGT